MRIKRDFIRLTADATLVNTLIFITDA
jgi:hypothetical protein